MKYILELTPEEKAQIDDCFAIAKQILLGHSEAERRLSYSEQGRVAFFLGEFYKRGQFTEIDEIKAVQAYAKGAALRHPQAQNRLGEAYYYGEGVPQDEILAVEWWCKASFSRCQAASEALDRIEAKTPRPGELQAKGWWLKEAFAGHPEAKLIYGHACFHGNDEYQIPKNEEMAVAWWLKSAKAGEAKAMYKLGDAYARGRGVEKSLSNAKDWYAQAESLGYELAKEKLEETKWQYIVRKRGGGD
ncbi:sel1 repeat protein [Lasius niger]|uniref:Sel1 repeat protein n=1 Tax=Lasius niger TaxID=67767 RepID=A0A0J7MV86_LASNI|nr:sel1 repeat protein [Lasius niger]